MTSNVISIIIPCRNERDHIEQCVRSIFAQERPAGEVEVIVSDGLSNDGTRDVLARLAGENPALRVIDNPAGIVSTGLNEAIRSARGNIIIRLDAHTEYAPDYIKRCVEVLERTAADNAGGPWIAKGAGLVSRAIAAAFQSAFGVGGARGHNADYEGPVDTVYLGCWRREVFDRIGLFDEELVRNQDDELNLRLTRAGGKIWQSPKIRSWYTPRGSLRLLFKQYAQYGYWKVRVIQKHRLPASWRHVVPGAFVFAICVLPLLGIASVSALYLWAAMITAYVVCNIAASIFVGARLPFRVALLLPVTFASYHFSYGLGFLHGIWDFIICRRQARASYSKLTRAHG